MRCYIDDEKVGAKFKQIAKPLRAKALAELEKVYTAAGFKPRGSGTDNVGVYMDIDIRRGMDMAQVYEFLTNADVAAVTVEPVDIEKIYGRNPGTLGFRRSIEVNGAAAVGLELIPPDELADAFTNAGNQGIDWTGFIDDAAVEKFITDDLISNGLLSAQDAALTDDWVEAPQRMGTYLGDHSDRYNGDMGDFAPDYSEEGEEW